MNFLIFVSLEPWDEIWRRNQFICSKLVERNPALRILFVEPPIDVSYALRTGRIISIFRRQRQTVGPGSRIVCTRALKILPNSLAWGRKFNEWMLQRHTLRLARRLGFDRAVLWINAHAAVHIAGRMNDRAVIYDVTDDWTEFKQSGQESELIRRQDLELCRKADAVIVCSERLLESKKRICDKVHLIPNGVDADHYKQVMDGNGPLPPETLEWTQPVFGYTGTVHPERIDLDLVQELARKMERGSIVLVGPNHLTPEQSAWLSDTGKIHLVGPVPYARIPEIMRAFAVCIVPHRVTPFTESLNPIKLWEYLAAGKPIVATDIAGFRDYPQAVAIARTASEFSDAMNAALHEPIEMGFQRRKLADGHSWENRVEMVESVIKEALLRAKQKSEIRHSSFAP